jgi:hypothetical protein
MSFQPHSILACPVIIEILLCECDDRFAIASCGIVVMVYEGVYLSSIKYFIMIRNLDWW